MGDSSVSAALVSIALGGLRCLLALLSAATPTLGQPDSSPVAGGAIAPIFLPNQGQWRSTTAFLSAFSGTQVRAEIGGVSLLLRDPESATGPRVVRFQLVPGAQPVGVAPRAHPLHYLVGNDFARHRSFLTGYGAVRFESEFAPVPVEVELLPGRLDFRASLAGAGHSPAVEFEIDGSEESPEPLPGGGLRVGATGAGLVFSAPVLSSGAGDVSCRFHVAGSRIGIDLPIGYAGDEDTSLLWSTFLGGSQGAPPTDVAIDDGGRAMVVGYCASADFPITPGALDETFEGYFQFPTEGFLVRYGRAGAVEYATFLGGSLNEDHLVVDVAADGGAVVALSTSSNDYPVTEGAFDTTPPAGSAVTRLSADGSSIVWSTLLGSPTTTTSAGFVRPAELMVLPDDTILVAGSTPDNVFPTTPGAFMEAPLDGYYLASKGFITRFSSDGSGLVYSTYFGGGADSDNINGVAVGPDGSIAFGGLTSNENTLPTTPGAIQPEHGGGGSDGFVGVLEPSGSSLRFLTYLGGPKGDRVTDVAFLGDGSVVVVGATNPQWGGFPSTPDAFQPAPASTQIELFISRISPDGTSLRWSTFLGGTSIEDLVARVHASPAGVVTVAGGSSSWNYPVTPGALQSTNFSTPKQSLVLSRLDPSGRSLLYSTYLGGSDFERLDVGLGLDVGPLGDLVVATGSESADFPVTPGAPQTTLPSGVSGVVAHLSMLPTGVTRVGAAMKGPHGSLAMGAASWPQVGNHAFALNCEAPQEHSRGWVVLAGDLLAEPQPLAGAQALIDPSSVLVAAPAQAGELGWYQVRLALPDDPAMVGLNVYAQCFWKHDGALRSSNALAITVQP